MHDETGHGRRPGRRREPGFRVVALAGTVLLAAACGGGSPSTAPTARTGQITAQMADVFARCMRNHGLANFYVTQRGSMSGSSPSGMVLQLGPNEIVQGVNPSSPQFQSAQKACHHLLPGRAPTAAQVQAMLRSLVKAAACMRAHGYPGYPDPAEQDGQPVPVPLPASIDTTSPQFLAALKACNAG